MKEDLSYLKFWLGITVATLLGASGWIFTNYDKSNPILLCLASLFVLILVIGIYFLNKAIRNKIKEISKE